MPNRRPPRRARRPRRTKGTTASRPRNGESRPGTGCTRRLIRTARRGRSNVRGCTGGTPVRLPRGSRRPQRHRSLPTLRSNRQLPRHPPFRSCLLPPRHPPFRSCRLAPRPSHPRPPHRRTKAPRSRRPSHHRRTRSVLLRCPWPRPVPRTKGRSACARRDHRTSSPPRTRQGRSDTASGSWSGSPSQNMSSTMNGR